MCSFEEKLLRGVSAIVQNLITLKWNVIILMEFSSLAALEVVILTTSSAANDENLIKMTTFPFHSITCLIN